MKQGHISLQFTKVQKNARIGKGTLRVFEKKMKKEHFGRPKYRSMNESG
jgi:hypothetical protein